MDKKQKKYRILALFLILVLLLSAGYIGWKALDYRRGAKEYESAIKIVDLPPRLEVSAEAGQESSWEIPEELLDILAQVDLDALRELNSDVAGWIVIPGTELSYPLLWRQDNSYYLNHTWTGVESSVGAIFLECQCSPDLSDFNTIIYGHRMRNGSMFGALRDYKSEDFWREHPVVYLVSDSSVYAYDIFAAYETGVREIVYRLGIEETEEKEELINFALSRTVIDTGIEPENQVLTLSTCTGQGHAARWVVQGVLRAKAER